jgi:hypothetical protein
MDASIQRALNDKLYDKRKLGALEYASASPQNPVTALVDDMEVVVLVLTRY